MIPAGVMNLNDPNRMTRYATSTTNAQEDRSRRNSVSAATASDSHDVYPTMASARAAPPIPNAQPPPDDAATALAQEFVSEYYSRLVSCLPAAVAMYSPRARRRWSPPGRDFESGSLMAVGRSEIERQLLLSALQSGSWTLADIDIVLVPERRMLTVSTTVVPTEACTNIRAYQKFNLAMKVLGSGFSFWDGIILAESSIESHVQNTMMNGGVNFHVSKAKFFRDIGSPPTHREAPVAAATGAASATFAVGHGGSLTPDNAALFGLALPDFVGGNDVVSKMMGGVEMTLPPLHPLAACDANTFSSDAPTPPIQMEYMQSNSTTAEAAKSFTGSTAAVGGSQFSAGAFLDLPFGDISGFAAANSSSPSAVASRGDVARRSTSGDAPPFAVSTRYSDEELNKQTGAPVSAADEAGFAPTVKQLQGSTRANSAETTDLHSSNTSSEEKVQRATTSISTSTSAAALHADLASFSGVHQQQTANNNGSDLLSEILHELSRSRITDLGPAAGCGNELSSTLLGPTGFEDVLQGAPAGEDADAASGSFLDLFYSILAEGQNEVMPSVEEAKSMSSAEVASKVASILEGKTTTEQMKPTYNAPQEGPPSHVPTPSRFSSFSRRTSAEAMRESHEVFRQQSSAPINGQHQQLYHHQRQHPSLQPHPLPQQHHAAAPEHHHEQQIFQSFDFTGLRGTAKEATFGAKVSNRERSQRFRTAPTTPTATTPLLSPMTFRSGMFNVHHFAEELNADWPYRLDHAAGSTMLHSLSLARPAMPGRPAGLDSDLSQPFWDPNCPVPGYEHSGMAVTPTTAHLGMTMANQSRYYPSTPMSVSRTPQPDTTSQMVIKREQQQWSVSQQTAFAGPAPPPLSPSLANRHHSNPVSPPPPELPASSSAFSRGKSGGGPTFWGMWEDERDRMVYVSWLPRVARAADRIDKKKCELQLKEFIGNKLLFQFLEKVLLFPPSSAHCKLIFKSEAYAQLFLNTYGGLEGAEGPEKWKHDVCEEFAVDIKDGIEATRVKIIWADQTKNTRNGDDAGSATPTAAPQQQSYSQPQTPRVSQHPTPLRSGVEMRSKSVPRVHSVTANPMGAHMNVGNHIVRTNSQREFRTKEAPMQPAHHHLTNRQSTAGYGGNAGPLHSALGDAGMNSSSYTSYDHRLLMSTTDHRMGTAAPPHSMAAPPHQQMMLPHSATSARGSPSPWCHNVFQMLPPQSSPRDPHGRSPPVNGANAYGGAQQQHLYMMSRPM